MTPASMSYRSLVAIAGYEGHLEPEAAVRELKDSEGQEVRRISF